MQLASHVHGCSREALLEMRSRASAGCWVVHSQQGAVDHDDQREPGVEVGAEHWHIMHGRAHLLGKDCGLQVSSMRSWGLLGTGCLECTERTTDCALTVMQ